MRWLMLVLTIAGFALTFTAKSAGVLALGLVCGFVGAIGLLFALASDRVSAAARPETAILGPEDLAAMRARQAAAAKPRAVPPAPVRPVAAAPAAAPPKTPPPAA
jgi:hypothetical protein